jgi:hypothetical protein
LEISRYEDSRVGEAREEIANAQIIFEDFQETRFPIQ